MTWVDEGCRIAATLVDGLSSASTTTERRPKYRGDSGSVRKAVTVLGPARTKAAPPTGCHEEDPPEQGVRRPVGRAGGMSGRVGRPPQPGLDAHRLAIQASRCVSMVVSRGPAKPRRPPARRKAVRLGQRDFQRGIWHALLVGVATVSEREMSPHTPRLSRFGGRPRRSAQISALRDLSRRLTSCRIVCKV